MTKQSDDLTAKLSALSPEQRARLKSILGREKGHDISVGKIAREINRAADGYVPLSFAQARLWFLDQYEPGSAFYNIPLAFRLSGALDIAALQSALSTVVRRHESLRTTFSVIDGRPAQIIHPPTEVLLPVTDLSHLSQASRDIEAMRLVTEEAQRPFDLVSGPLLRANLVQLSLTEHVVLLTVHHIVSDRWSSGILKRELSVLYEACLSKLISPLPELAIQYADYAIWQRKWLQGDVLNSQLAYWKRQLNGAPPFIELPTDYPRPATQSYRGARQTAVLDKHRCATLKTFSQEEKATLFMTLLTAFEVLLHRYTHTHDIVIGSPIAGRTRTDTEHLIGFFVNTLVLRTDCSGNPMFRELLARVRATALSAYAHQDIPFEKLVEELKPERNLSYAPLFQVMFVLQNVADHPLSLRGLEVSRIEQVCAISKFDLSLSVTEIAEELELVFEYSTDLFDAATITRMLGHYQALLDGIIANVDQRIADLPLLGEGEAIHSAPESRRTHTKFSGIFIGIGTLLIQCAEIFLNGGHEIRSVISADIAIRHWAKQKGIAHFTPDDAWQEFLLDQDFDFLFSIVNILILPEEILARPRRLAINYHDGPLPKYAGTYVTSWAIMQHEKTYGVTWHVMSKRVDTGAILKQRGVMINSNETAFSLNIKCYEAGIQSFTELLDDLLLEQIPIQKQTLSERSFFPRYHRPPAAGIISWDQCAHDVGAFVRALDFGSYANPLGLPKLAIGGEYFIITKVDVLDSHSSLPPGTINRISVDSIEVATASNDISLGKLLTIDGEPLSVANFVARFALHEGECFATVDPLLTKRITETNASVCKHEAFWVKRLVALPALNLPYTKASRQPARYTSRSVNLPAETLNFLKQHPAGSTSNFLLAAWGAYFARITDTYDFDIGFSYPKLQFVAGGIFSTYVPLHMTINPAQDFSEVFLAVRDEVEIIKRHETFVKDIGPRYPVLRSLPALRESLPVIVKCINDSGNQSAIFGSLLTLIIPEEGSECCFVYDTERLNEINITAMVNQFITFLQGIVTDPDRAIGDLPLMSKDEKQRFLGDFNTTVETSPACIHHLFEAQVARTPEAVAVEFDGLVLTYNELNIRANRLAHHLQGLGVGPETLVGICMERSLEMVVGFLGIFKEGGAYVPLDPSYPKERLAFMLADANIQVLLTQQYLKNSLPEHAAQVICLDMDGEEINGANNPASAVTADNLAYVIYTSGSTGTPKGVMIQHGSLSGYIETTNLAYGIKPGDRVLQFASISFDASVEEIYTCLTQGATLVLRTESMIDSAVTFLKKCRDWALTVVILPTAYWHQLAASLEAEALEIPQSVRLMVVGGEKMLTEPLRIWRKHVSERVRLVNTYGPTEATVVATMYELSNNAQAAGYEIPIGRALRNVQIYMLDRRMQLVPVGVVGELHIGGASLARGYLNRPDLTAQKFIRNPFSDNPDSRLYKTGDLARYLPDGNIEFLGRIDHQVKIRGFRIELGEIETVLGQHPHVREAVVIAREDTPGDKRLVAYVVANGTQNLIAELRSFLKDRLPDYMLPVAYVMLDALPLTSNDKIDRKALPTLEQSRPELEETYVAPRTTNERTLATIWSEVLKLENIGIHDNFFDLGGHSLLATQVISRIRTAFHIELPLRTLFEAPTLVRLAEAITKRGLEQLNPAELAQLLTELEV